MIPVDFEECNVVFGPPKGFEESQVRTIKACAHTALGGPMDGVQMVTVAWMPTPEERQRLAEGGPVFVTMCGGLAPHFLTTSLEEARHPA